MMTAHRWIILLAVLALLTSIAYPQGLTTTQTKDDWEEINFEFNSSILSDGYPSLLRLADLLKSNPSYKVRLEGNADWIGSNRYNDKLALARANTVRAFLEKYGAQPGQIEVTSHGEVNPEVPNTTAEGRFINRRVKMTVTDGEGRIVGAGGVGDAIKALEKIAQKQEECCNEILKRLDKLDEILSALNELKGENARLRKDIDELRQAHAGLRKEVEGLPKREVPTNEELSDLAEKASMAALAKNRTPRFSLLGLNVGADNNGDITFTGKGRYFAPFKDHFAIQAQGEYLGFRDRKEGQFDIGLVNRYKNVQLGLFSSFKAVNLGEFQRTGTLGQGSVTADWLFSRGKVGIFGAKGFMNSGVVNTKVLGPNLIEETFMQTVDQVGASATVALMGNTWAEGNFGYLKSHAHADRPGGTLRFVFPLNSRLAFTIEGGMNETLLGRDNNGRVVAGIQFGNFIRPKEFVGLSHPVPVDVPRVRYELLTRRVRTGNDAPVADAGPDQIGVQAGAITLDGSASFDPDGDPITFQWSQVAGPAVSLSGMATATATFTAAEGQTYSFRLLVKDDHGAQSIARVSVSTREKEQPPVRIVSFTANPATIQAGQQSVLTWQVENADEVTIDRIGSVDAKSGTFPVTPTETTVYTLTARNSKGQVSAAAVVTVSRPEVRIIRFQASPMNIMAGESSTLSWQTENADEVTLTGVGPVSPNGSTVVSPTETTTYTLTARNGFGQVTGSATVQVTPGTAPRVVRFTASPTEIAQGQSSALNWVVENATEVTITTLGKVDPQGTSTVTPSTTTTYTLVASNALGQVTVTATVTVVAPVKIVSFTATPNPIGKPNDPVTLTWATDNATEVVISNAIGPRVPNGAVTLRVTEETTFTLVATGRGGSQATASVTVTIGPPPPPVNRAPIARTVANFTTVLRNTFLDGTTSYDPDSDPITYQWRSLDGAATVLTPNDPIAHVQLGDQFRDYAFELTVTDDKGATSSANIVVTLVPER